VVCHDLFINFPKPCLTNLPIESEDEGARVVKSAKDRTWDSLRDIVKKIHNAMKTDDWPKIQDEFNELNSKIDKSKRLIADHGLPKFYVKVLAEVADFVTETLKDKEAIKRMKPVVTKALNQMRSQVKKHNENYTKEITHYRENVALYASDDEESDESYSAEDESDDSGDSEEDSDASSSSSDSDDDDSDEDSDDSSDKVKAKPKVKSKVRFSTLIV
jgi:translation initiation factor 3 subunit C